MLKKEDIVTKAWADYELIDSGEGRKLERFGAVITDRPDTQAIWPKQKPAVWEQAVAVFTQEGKEAQWKNKTDVPTEWTISWNGLTVNLRFGNFKHLGIFPEHAIQWEWVGEKVKELKEKSEEVKVLNLFGYTGAASITAAQAGAKVTHVDASKQSVTWANENAAASGLPDDAIRWIVDDAADFVKREAKRGNKYDGIVLDPPAFGRGAKGQVWHIAEDLMPLLEDLKEILNPGAFVVLSGYAAGYAPEAFAQLVSGIFGDQITGTFGALHIAESEEDRLLPTGIYTRFVN